MLIRFSVENYRSIKDRVTLDLTARKNVRDDEKNVFSLPTVSHDEGFLRLIAILGRNAAGKSTVLRALDIMHEFILNSAAGTDGDLIPIFPFKLDANALVEPSKFEIEFVCDGVRCIYGFEANHTLVLREYLHVYKNPPARQTWFERNYDESAEGAYRWQFSEHFKRDDSTKDRTLANTLYFSKCVQDNNQMILPLNQFFRTKLRINAQYVENDEAISLVESETGKQKVMSFLKAADFTIDDIEIERRPLYIPEEYLSNMPDDMKERVSNEQVAEAKTFHRNTETGELIKFDLQREESIGTAKMFSLAGAVIRTLECGGVLFIDELEHSLDSRVFHFLINLFNDPSQNPQNAQLVFTTHNVLTLDAGLRRDQIWLASKGRDKATTLYPLVDVAKFKEGAKSIRKNQDIIKAFLDGKLDTPPQIQPQQLSLDLHFETPEFLQENLEV